ncbi:hypothetical protein N7495_001335 [Penicillium taxi]|uniref:uncharacterized protein n=1 Tax=Penicillium taxi TaxID=168475 RepID=UPI0025454080|nr:uncharacterized protein N7495_001335 [Penicillium taxi]KAJ5908653.1 hypothetical protein N7495_001335 [Penicillium taxi]
MPSCRETSDRHARGIHVKKNRSSLAYGTPPYISRLQHDLPPPKSEYFAGNSQDTSALEVFIALADLTSILDYCLEQVYNIHHDNPDLSWNLHSKLDQWVQNLKGDVRKIIIHGVKLDIPGASNLRLAFLSIKLLLQRIDLDRWRQSSNSINPAQLANQSILPRRTAEEIVVLVQELQDEHLGDFWRPVAAFIFTSTTTFLLRCALETGSHSELSYNSSLQMAHEFLSSLRSHKERMGWDLADTCLAQHSEVVETLLSSAPIRDATNLNQQAFMPDMDFIGAMFPSVWDNLTSIYE